MSAYTGTQAKIQRQEIALDAESVGWCTFCRNDANQGRTT
jgi:hypothetical protein